ncbi:hypothetical protein CGZ80_16445 [Rhodopirellula sp. MGV]|nr:hypothetical protein CGZ80_16445 [Rhodopirellula sp. MGV]PNY35625.1 hypothetical protein C2E31_17330 [Rhodopirellula baltica]PNY37355.1 hypothetical protein C2E31_08225 [Rhodopirellula baltica]
MPRAGERDVFRAAWRLQMGEIEHNCKRVAGEASMLPPSTARREFNSKQGLSRSYVLSAMTDSATVDET